MMEKLADWVLCWKRCGVRHAPGLRRKRPQVSEGKPFTYYGEGKAAEKTFQRLRLGFTGRGPEAFSFVQLSFKMVGLGLCLKHCGVRHSHGLRRKRPQVSGENLSVAFHAIH